MENITVATEDESIEGVANGDVAKVVAMLTLGVGSFIFGALPVAIPRGSGNRFPLLTSLFLCFGAGVLLATSLVHMLPDVRKEMPNTAEIALCGGFFIVYFVDEFIHYFFGEAIQHSHENPRRRHSHNHSHSHSETHSNTNGHRHYGSNSETDALLGQQETQQTNHPHCDTDAANARICHTSHTEPCVQTMTGTMGLLVALSLHSLIEGLAIGVQSSASKVYFLLLAVGCHKFVMGFCLGLEIRTNVTSTVRSLLIAVGVFSMGSALGIGLGMAFVDIPASWTKSALPILQALAGGTLLYVTVCEVMPREKARWHQTPGRKSAGLIQFLAVGIGFTVMTLINFYLDDD